MEKTFTAWLKANSNHLKLLDHQLLNYAGIKITSHWVIAKLMLSLRTLNPTLSITDNLKSVQAWYLSKLPLWKMYYCNIASMLYQRYVNPSKEFIPTAILLTGTHLWEVLPAHASFRLILGDLNLIQSS